MKDFNQRQERDWKILLFVLGIMFGILSTLIIQILIKHLIWVS